jgi:ABC-2 type transport system ATP-binding protein
MTVIELHGVRKTYRRLRKPPEHALAGLDLVVPEGGVFGFLGPNGSGKTTTIRALLGLISTDAGELRLLGQPVPRNLPQVVGSVGALVETPLFFPTFSGRLNLQLLAQAAGVPDRRVEECLELVGLHARAGDKFRTYSLGMKQRLGIAAALLKRPRVLILDEPSNGLDPSGIREVRELVKRLGAEPGVTVFLSSHLLGEVQQVCDHVAILARGRCVTSGRVADVLAARSSHAVRVRVDEPERAGRVLAEAGHPVAVADGALRVENVPEPAAVTKLLADQGLYLSELTPLTADLETVFLALTEGADLAASGSGPAPGWGARPGTGQHPWHPAGPGGQPPPGLDGGPPGAAPPAASPETASPTATMSPQATAGTEGQL